MSDKFLDTLKQLKKPLDPKFVKKRPDNKMSYIEGWAVEDIANEVFQYQWDSEVIELTENTQPTTNKNGNHVVSFRAKVRVKAFNIVKDGIGYGSGFSKDIHSAYERAIKEAETDAEKRAFKKFGYRFGLALYDKEQKGVKDVDLYDVELNKCAFLCEEIESYFDKNKTNIAQAWKDKAKDLAFVKRVDKEAYNKLLAIYAGLKKRK